MRSEARNLFLGNTSVLRMSLTPRVLSHNSGHPDSSGLELNSSEPEYSTPPLYRRGCLILFIFDNQKVLVRVKWANLRELQGIRRNTFKFFSEGVDSRLTLNLDV